MDQQIVSQEGYQKLVDELNLLTTVKRREIADRIERAKELGDLSENAEYAEAKDAQSFNESRVSEITNLLKNLIVVENKDRALIGLGSTVNLETDNGKKVYKIVSFNEADPINGKISNESPIGLALLGRKKGEIVQVRTPKGVIEYRIVNIE